MGGEEIGSRRRRAELHRALGDQRRLAIVDALRLSDRTPSDLAVVTGLASNLLAFHLGALEEVGVIERSTSQGDARRRYVRMTADPVVELGGGSAVTAERVLFVCTGNSARSQLAAGLWGARTGRPAASAGTRPAEEIHPHAVTIARRHGLVLGERPRGYDEVPDTPDLVVSVCDRAREAGPPPFDAPSLHWSIPDPAGGDRADFEAVHDQLASRVERLALAAAA